MNVLPRAPLDLPMPDEKYPEIRWHGYLGGKPGEDRRHTISFVLPDGKQPNWFNRLMQYLILGIYWEKKIN